MLPAADPPSLTCPLHLHPQECPFEIQAVVAAAGEADVLWRFSLYGFLKNQRYFEPFLYLAFPDKGLSFAMIGLLISCREIAKNLLEIPSGAIADMWGRRRAMMLSFTAYIASFAVLGYADGLPLLFCGMALFGVGEAFRTGTHKAMIFCWLRAEGRIDERTRVYGYTRSWSQIGSAVSVIVAAGLVLATLLYGAARHEGRVLGLSVLWLVTILFNVAMRLAFGQGPFDWNLVQ